MYRPGRYEAKMADIDFEDFDAGYPIGPAVSVRRYDRAMHLAGAATSVVLLVGAVWWGYQLAVRDVTGVPVMRALGGAMRVAPTDPGGNVAGYQGLSVNAVAAAGTATPLPDEFFLAPAAQTLAEEDAAGLAQPLIDMPGGSAEALPAIGAGFSASEPLIATEIPTADQGAVAAALAEALGGIGASETQPVLAFATRADVGAGLTRSLRPQARPADASSLATSALSSEPVSVSATATDTTATDTTATDTTAALSTEVDQASVAVGTRLVQLGAFDEAALARADWTRLVGRFPELMADKSLVVQPAQSGGRTFYRLRAMGFEGEDEARRFCSALLAENATCIPVAQR
jgi:hypothetical protein